MKLNFIVVFCALLAQPTAHTWGQDSEAVDCTTPTTQSDMNDCTWQEYQAADKKLNEQYKKTRSELVEVDQDYKDKYPKGAENALVAAQRAWIAYRDAQCKIYGYQAKDGTAEPMIISGCLREMTEKRTKELSDISQAMNP